MSFFRHCLCKPMAVALFWALIGFPKMARSTPICTQDLADALEFQRGRSLIFTAGIEQQLRALQAPKLAPESKARIQGLISYFESERDVARARMLEYVGRLKREGKDPFSCPMHPVLTPQMKEHLANLGETVKAQLSSPVSEEEFLKILKDQYLKNGDEVNRAVFRGIGIGFKKAGMELVNVGADSMGAVLVTVFDPEAAQYYEIRSGLFQSIEKNGLADTVAAIPSGLYESTVVNGLSGDPEKAGEAWANSMMFLVGTKMTATQMGKIGGSVSQGLGKITVPVPALEFAPSLNGTVAFSYAAAQANITPIVSMAAGTAGGSGPMVVACTAIRPDGSPGGSGSGGGKPASPNVSDRFVPRDPPADVTPESTARLFAQVDEKVAKLSREEFMTALQGWLDDIHTVDPSNSRRKGYFPGRTPQDTIRTVQELIDDVKAKKGTPAQALEGAPLKVRQEYFGGTEVFNGWGQMNMLAEPGMLEMFLESGAASWSSLKDGIMGRALLQRFMLEMEKVGYQAPANSS